MCRCRCRSRRRACSSLAVLSSSALMFYSFDFCKPRRTLVKAHPTPLIPQLPGYPGRKLVRVLLHQLWPVVLRPELVPADATRTRVKRVKRVIGKGKGKGKQAILILAGTNTHQRVAVHLRKCRVLRVGDVRCIWAAGHGRAFVHLKHDMWRESKKQ